MGFNYVDLLLINDLVEHPELFVFCALTNEHPVFMQVLVLHHDGLWVYLCFPLFLAEVELEIDQFCTLPPVYFQPS